MALVLRGYYAVLNLQGEAPEDPAALLARAGERLAAQPACLQLRAKRMGAADLRRTAALLLPACHAAGVPLCVNDRLDVALAAGADGVHLGQDDLPLRDGLRIRASQRLIVGVSTHTLAQAQAASRAGADYIGFGPIFATQTKANCEPAVGLAPNCARCALRFRFPWSRSVGSRWRPSTPWPRLEPALQQLSRLSTTLWTVRAAARQIVEAFARREPRART